jgi:hypothetical protein
MRYLVRERLFSVGDDSWVTGERGDKVFLVDGKALRLHETFELKDASGRSAADGENAVACVAIGQADAAPTPGADHGDVTLPWSGPRRCHTAVVARPRGAAGWRDWRGVRDLGVP